MNGQAITFDFHNTLATCPEWFELEVRRLPSGFLRWWADSRGPRFVNALAEEADFRYRDLRRDIIEHGNELTAEACLATVFGAMSLTVPEADVAAGVEHLMRGALAEVSPIPGAIEAVIAIHAAGVPVGVVSSAVYHPFLEWTLDSFGVQDAIQVVITSASAGYYKSRPELYWHAAERLGVAPDRIVHVGDSLRFDVAGAGKAGMGTVWLQGNGAVPGDGSARPDLTLRSLEAAAPDILSLLKTRLATLNRSDG